MNYTPPCLTVPGISQAKIWNWIAISFSRGWSQCSSQSHMNIITADVCVCVCVCVLATQLCSALCDLMEGSLSGFSVHGIFQARIPEWMVIHFSRGSSPPRNWTLVSCIYRLSYQGCPTKVAVSDSLSESKNRISHLWQKQNETSTYPFQLFIGKIG